MKIQRIEVRWPDDFRTQCVASVGEDGPLTILGALPPKIMCLVGTAIKLKILAERQGFCDVEWINGPFAGRRSYSISRLALREAE